MPKIKPIPPTSWSHIPIFLYFFIFQCSFHPSLNNSSSRIEAISFHIVCQVDHSDSLAYSIEPNAT